jgi:DNA excision repair protein ERCC-4
LLTYDAVAFNQLLETVLTTNAPAAGSTRQNHSPWLFLDAAQEVFKVAKERVYMSKPEEMSGEAGIIVVLEQLPKLVTLREVLEEIEHEIHLSPQNGIPLHDCVDKDDGTNAVVVMCTDERTCKQLREYLQSDGSDAVLRRKLQEYFTWKSNFQKSRTQLFEKKPENGVEEDGTEDPRLKLKRRGAPPNKRRRVRGGAPITSRNASGVVEIPDDNPDDLSQM